MRRIAVLLSAPLLAVAPLAVAACGSSGPSTPSVSVSGSFGKSPTITIPSQTAGSNLTVKTLIKGSGPALSKSDAFVGNYAVYIWSGKTHKLAQSTFQTKTPQLFSGTLLPGLEILLTPGHAPAHQSVLLRLPETGPVIICGDAVYCQENFDHDSWGGQADPEVARKSAFKLRETAKREGAQLFYGHDRNQARDIRYAPHSYR